MGKAEGLPPAWCQALERAAGVRGGRGQKRRLETGKNANGRPTMKVCCNLGRGLNKATARRWGIRGGFQDYVRDVSSQHDSVNFGSEKQGKRV